MTVISVSPASTNQATVFTWSSGIRTGRTCLLKQTGGENASTTCSGKYLPIKYIVMVVNTMGMDSTASQYRSDLLEALKLQIMCWISLHQGRKMSGVGGVGVIVGRP